MLRTGHYTFPSLYASFSWVQVHVLGKDINVF